MRLRLWGGVVGPGALRGRCLASLPKHLRRIELFRPNVAPEENVASCVGCGWALQSVDVAALGFVPPTVPSPVMDPLSKEAAVEEAAVKRCLCQRCWRLRHHNSAMGLDAPDQSSKLRTLKDRPGVVVLIGDLSDAQGTLPLDFARNVSGANPVVLVGNKLDLLPAGATEYRLRTWLLRQAERRRLLPTSTHVVSSRTGVGVTALVRDLAERSHSFKKDVFLCGRTNVGKSSLLSKMIRMYGGPTHLKPTVSPLHGTTVGLIPVPLGHNGGRSLYDTPGLLGEHRVHTVLSRDELAVVTPEARIRPVVVRLIPGKSVLLGGFGRLDYVEGAGHLLFTVFVSARLAKEVVATAVDKRAGTGPHALEPVEFCFDGDDPAHSWNAAWTEVAFSGIGWVSVTGRAPGGPIRLVAHGLRGALAPEAREPLMPFEAAAVELKRHERTVVKHGSVTRFQQRRNAASL